MNLHTPPTRELDYREGDGLQVWLLWLPSEDRVLVRILDIRSEAVIDLPTDPAHALDAFRHPFAYVGRPGPTVFERERSRTPTTGEPRLP